MSFLFSLSDPVASYLERYPDAPAVLARLGIDPVQDLDRPIGDAPVSEHQLDLLAVELHASRWHEDEDWTSADLEDLVLHISDAHHVYLASELPRLMRLTRRLANEDQSDRLDARMRTLAQQLQAHIEREEAELFPACRSVAIASYGAALPNGKRLRLSANDLQIGHEDIERELPLLLALVDGGTPDPIPGLREALRTGLAALADDLQQHHYEEEDCLIPAVMHCEEVLSRPVLRSDRGSPP